MSSGSPADQFIVTSSTEATSTYDQVKEMCISRLGRFVLFCVSNEDVTQKMADVAIIQKDGQKMILHNITQICKTVPTESKLRSRLCLVFSKTSTPEVYKNIQANKFAAIVDGITKPPHLLGTELGAPVSSCKWHVPSLFI